MTTMKPQLKLLKQLFLSTLFVIGITFFTKAQQGVGVGTKTPDGSAMLDITSLNKGLLIPRIQTLTGINDATTITAPAPSLLIYTSINNLNPGYYYNSGDANLPVWVRLSTGNDNVGNVDDWSITGNKGLDNNKFLGHIDSVDLVFRTNNASRVTIKADGGFLALGNANGEVPYSGSGSRFMWAPRRYALRAGYVNANQWDTDNVGTGSLGVGINVRASGATAVALNNGTFASGMHSMSIGDSTEASGPGSFASGHATRATGLIAFATGSVNIASGEASFVAGERDTASGKYAVAFGNRTISSGTGSFATGVKTQATGLGSIVAGLESKALGNYSTASGFSSEATKTASFATGNNTTASGDYSASFNSSTTASGAASFAAGMGTEAIAMTSTAFGVTTKAYGEGSFVTGNNTSSFNSASYSLAFGDNSNTIGANSLAGGFKSSASGANSIGIGNTVYASGNNSIAVGVETSAAGAGSIVGGFKSTSSILALNSLAIGNLASATGENAVALGFNVKATALNSIAIGANNTANLESATALGFGTTASEMGAIAMGVSTNASGYASLSAGDGTTASGDKSAALGEQTIAKAKGALAIGSYNEIATDIAVKDNPQPNDRLFQIGGGTNNLRNTIFSVRRDGRTGINVANPTASLHIKARNFANDGSHIRLESPASTVYGAISYGVTGMQFKNSEADDVFAFRNSAQVNTMTLSNAGNMVITGTLTENSDIRLKENISPLKNVLNKIDNIQPITYYFKDKKSHPSTHQIGFNAQEIEREFPELVNKNEKEYLSVSYSKMSAVAIQAIKEQQQTINAQQQKIEQLDNKNTALEKDVEQLKIQMQEVLKKLNTAK